MQQRGQELNNSTTNKFAASNVVVSCAVFDVVDANPSECIPDFRYQDEK
jgi:hypothetical protein